LDVKIASAKHVSYGLATLNHQSNEFSIAC